MAANLVTPLSDESSSSDQSVIADADMASVSSRRSDESSASARCRCNLSKFYKFEPQRLGTMRRMSTLGGFYWQLGIEDCLGRCYRTATSPRTLALDISIHRMVFNEKQIFPIIGTIYDDPDRAPFLIGMQEYKHTNNSYNAEDLLKYFVLEAQKLTEKGWAWNEHQVPFKVRKITCDLSVIGCVRGVPPFDSPFGCGVCTVIARMQRGLASVKIRSYPTEFFQQHSDTELRNRQEDRAFIYWSPQRYILIDCQPSPLLKLPTVDMIADIVPNPRQLLYTGAMKLLLTSWIGSQQHYTGIVWSEMEMERIDRRTSDIRPPYELNRRQTERTPPRLADLLTAADWHEYDYGMMLHYYGLAVLKNHLRPALYEHFLHLFCAVTICSSKQYSDHTSTARYCFEVFMRGCETHYGIIPNVVHGLRHLGDAIERFGPLRPLSASDDGHDQLLEFLHQRMLHQPEGDSVSQLLMNCVKRFNDGDRPGFLPNAPMIRVRNRCFLHAEYFEDRWFMTRSRMVVKLESASETELVGRELCEPLVPFFTTPMHSSIINVLAVESLEPTYGPIKHYHLADVLCKLMVMVSDNKFLFVPVLCTMPN